MEDYQDLEVPVAVPVVLLACKGRDFQEGLGLSVLGHNLSDLQTGHFHNLVADIGSGAAGLHCPSQRLQLVAVSSRVET